MSADLDTSAVIDWNGRPRRSRKPPPKTYWDEYVATDTWYVREMLSDVPPDELHAALEDETWGEADGEEGDEELEGGESDADYSEQEGEESSDGTSPSDEGSVDSMDTDVDSGTEGASDRYSPHTPSDSPTPAGA
jgi:hypothetical protein